MVFGGRGASWCGQPMGGRSLFYPCMPGWMGVGRPVCRLYIVGSFFLQQFGWYTVVLPALWSACASWGRLRCSPRQSSRMLSLLSFRLVLRFAVASMSDVAVIALRPGRARRVVLVRRRRGHQWSACLGLCGGPYGPGRPRLVAVGRSLRHSVPVRGVVVVARPVMACPRMRLLRCCQNYVSLVLFVGSCLRCLMVGLSCRWMCRLFRVGSGRSSCVGPAWHALAVRRPLMMGRASAVLGLPLGGACPWGVKSFENWYAREETV